MSTHHVTRGLLATLLIGVVALATSPKIAATGPSDRPVAGVVTEATESMENSPCLPAEQMRLIQSQLPPRRKIPQGAAAATTLFADPMGNGGIHGFGNAVSHYFDHELDTSLMDFSCGALTYNGHTGTDISIAGFYAMDEGVPILCAAPGTVIYSHDGEYDRYLVKDPSAVANAVVVEHADGTRAWYVHMRKNSVSVDTGDVVAVGDTLGYVGSSGPSSGPHLHFQVVDSINVDPFTGSCQADASRWISQPPHVLDLPVELREHGLTALQPTYALRWERPPSRTHIQAPDTVYSWIKLRGIKPTDTVKYVVYENNNVYFMGSGYSPAQAYGSFTMYLYLIIPPAPLLFGDWRVEIYLNSVLAAQQNFTVNDQPNQAPMTPDSVLELDPDVVTEGEFVVDDPDGSIFWYEIDDLPDHGQLDQHGGRRRKFTYTPDPGFHGVDTVWFHAIDDDSLSGPVGPWVFAVGCPVALTGDEDASGTITSADVIYMVNFVFKGGPEPKPIPEAGDVNCDGSITSADVIYLVNYVFKGGPEPCDVCTIL